ncbi:hypothetical protein HK101_003587 [Irineochytrium annulatum]|nr:hypothetical protein HK101_003587 [Irineochytrium annulatum]
MSITFVYAITSSLLCLFDWHKSHYSFFERQNTHVLGHMADAPVELQADLHSNTAVMVLTPKQATAFATAWLIVKYFVTLNIQDEKNLPTLQKMFGKGITQSFGTTVHADDDKKMKKARMEDIRWDRIVRNDIENIPLGLIAANLFSDFAASPSVHVGCVLTYALARTVHTYFYAKEMQPHRGIAWFGKLLGSSAPSFFFYVL